MKLLSFRRSATPKVDTKPLPKHTEPAQPSSSRRGIVLIDDTDLTQYGNNYELYDTGPRGGISAMLDVHATPPVATTKARAAPPFTKGMSDPVILQDANTGRTYEDSPVICELESTFATSEVDGHRHHRGRKASMSSVDVLVLPIPNGAIRPGGSAKLFGTQYIGLLVNWLFIGLIEGGSQTLVKPLFAHYLHMQQSQVHAAATLVQSAWFFKVVAAFLSDAIPIHYQRRKPYIYIGWALFSLCMLGLVCMPGVAPYLSSDGKVSNGHASTQGTRYLPFLVVASFGHLLVAVACEGLMVELAQRESEYRRGRTQCILVLCELVGQAIGTLIVSLGFNSVSFGGHFPAALPLPLFFGFLGVLAMLGIVLTWFVIVDEVNTPTAPPLSIQLRRFAGLAQRRPIWKLMVFGFICTSALAVQVLEASDVYTTWLHARAFDLNLSTVAASAGAAVATFLFYRFWINTNWRALLCGSVALSIVVALPIELLTYLDAWRSLGVFLAKDLLVSVASTVMRLLQLLVIIEVAEPGLEATTYAMVTTTYNLAGPFVAIVSNVMASTASIQKQDLAIDSANVRHHVTVELSIVTALRIVLVFVASPLLPRQKRHAKELNAKGAHGDVVAVVIHTVFLAVYVAVATSSVLALSETTSCLVFAGGNGCS